MLVLDDYHRISNERVHGVLDLLLEHLPNTLQLAIATRSQPPLAVDPAASPASAARRRPLRSSASPTPRPTSLLNGVLRLELDDGDIARLQARTEGWAAGLQLAALSLSRRDDAHEFIASFAGDDRPIVDYLGFEELTGWPAARSCATSCFARRSVLDRMTGPLCDPPARHDRLGRDARRARAGRPVPRAARHQARLVPLSPPVRRDCSGTSSP